MLPPRATGAGAIPATMPNRSRKTACSAQVIARACAIQTRNPSAAATTRCRSSSVMNEISPGDGVT